MKYLLSALLVIFAFSQTKAQYLDEISKKLHEPKALRKDVDFVQRKLEKEHINLYKFISKKALDHKFDSLRASITKPMISLKFNARLMTVLSAIGDGHLISTYNGKRFTPLDMEYLQKPKKQNGLYNLDYVIVNKHLYVKQNNGPDEHIKRGDEIISIDNKAAAQIIDTMMCMIASDGYNTTFKKSVINADNFINYYNFYWDRKDTNSIELKSNNTVKKIDLLPPTQSNVGLNLNNAKPISYKFLKPDSSIAYLKVRTFMLDSTFKNFEDIFNTIKQAKSKVLVLDLRGNGGGLISHSSNLFSYLTTKPANFFNRPDELIKGYLIPGLNKLRDQQIKWLKQSNYHAQVLLQHNGFWGDLYVLTDGGTFSAASLLTANLKKYRQATIVGEETGGSRNIWTAGIMKSEVLPESKMTLTYGILPFTFGDVSDNTGRGTMPDVLINYTIDDYLAKRDLEMEWVMRDVEKKDLK
ncbi:MAG: S41 family peptidase [Bacteroidota bacterium]